MLFYMTVVDANIYVKIDGHMDQEMWPNTSKKVKNTMIATIVCNLYRNTAVQWLTLTLPLEALHHECFIRKPSLLRAFDELSRNEGVWQATYPYSGNQGYIRNLGVPIYRFTQHCVNNWRYGNPLYHSTMLQVVSASDVTPTDLKTWSLIYKMLCENHATFNLILL